MYDTVCGLEKTTTTIYLFIFHLRFRSQTKKKQLHRLICLPHWLLEVSALDRYMQSVLRVELGPCCPCQNSDVRLRRDSSKDRSKFHLFEGSSGLQFTNFSFPFSLLLMKEIHDHLFFRCKRLLLQAQRLHMRKMFFILSRKCTSVETAANVGRVVSTRTILQLPSCSILERSCYFKWCIDAFRFPDR